MAITVTIPRIVNSMVGTNAAIAWSKISKVGALLSELGGSVTAGQLPSGIDAAKIADGSVSNTEFQYLDGLTSGIQAQLNGISTPLAPKHTTRRSLWVNCWPGNNTPTVVGWTGISTVGTLSDGSTTAHSMVNVASVSVNSLGIRTSASIATHFSQHDPTLSVRIKTGASIANISFFLGFWSVASTTADSAGAHYGGIRFSTAAADSGWVGICNDGTLGNHQTSAQIAAIAINTEYLLVVTFSGDGTLLTLTINGGTPVTMATHLPSVATGLFPQATVRNLVAEAKSFAIGEFYVEWD